ncbi:cobalamin B12-binding domain-containing protein [Actinopolyspora erythraea]|nr:cobalamin-dependent protein [Actinopolyspora erythraea]
MTGSELARPTGSTGDEEMRVLLSSVPSDAHTWNLVFLQLALEQAGIRVWNLGACVPTASLLDAAGDWQPDAVVISTVNGHGYPDGRHLIGEFRARPPLRSIPIVIGGKLGIAGASDRHRIREMVRLGFDAVFPDDADFTELESFLRGLPATTARAMRSEGGPAC